MSMPPGWEHDSNTSIWEQMKSPEDSTKASSKKRKKRAHDNEHQLYVIFAIHKKVTREYLTRWSMNTVEDEALTAELCVRIFGSNVTEEEVSKRSLGHIGSGNDQEAQDGSHWSPKTAPEH
jgi:hypothetical protein